MSEIKNRFSLRKVISIFAVVVSAILIEVVLKKLSHNLLLSGLFGISILTGFSVYLRKCLKASIFQIISYNFITILMANYMFYTMLSSTFRASTMFIELSSNPSQISGILTVCSLSYGISQMLGGYVIGRFGVMGYIVMTILASLSIFLQGSALTNNSLYFFRIMCGILLSITGVISSFYSSRFWDIKYINIIGTSILFFAFKIAAVFSDIAFKSIQTVADGPGLNWRCFFRFISFLNILICIAFLVYFVIFSPKKVQETQKKVKEEVKEKESILGEFFQLLKNDRRILAYCFSNACAVMIFYFFRGSGFLVDLTQNLFPSLDKNILMVLLDNSSAYALIIFPMLVGIFCMESLVFLLALICFSCTTLFIFSPSILTAKLLALGATCGFATHFFPNMILAKDHGDKPSAGLMYAILNMFTMFIGAFCGQKIGISIVNREWVKSGSLLIDGRQFISPGNIIVAIKFMAVVILVSCFWSFYSYLLKPKTCSKDCSK